ncbi:hypothetical protein J6590_101685 [Homalodisca vitripennis]|nr:hypothetical protein J6590_089727 [Homalodisca vitripennis]KAG8269707.1 hypothetical protein J6590_101685 [Homalodisca vitripennis]
MCHNRIREVLHSMLHLSMTHYLKCDEGAINQHSLAPRFEPPQISQVDNNETFSIKFDSFHFTLDIVLN